VDQPSRLDAHEGEVWDLQNLANATHLCDWMFDQYAHAIGASAAEIGAGIGTFSRRLLDKGVSRLLLIEPEPACLRVLEQRFSANPVVELSGDSLPNSPALDAARESLDFILCQNALEHIADDAGTVRSIALALKPGGRVALLVPANPRLFGRIDRLYEHQRRYTRERIESVMASAELEIEDLYGFNVLGVLGWWVKNRIGRPEIDIRSLRTYELVVRAWRPIEDRWRPRTGLSFVALARKA
jgi:SAM-dependent methyltransferase